MPADILMTGKTEAIDDFLRQFAGYVPISQSTCVTNAERTNIRSSTQGRAKFRYVFKTRMNDHTSGVEWPRDFRGACGVCVRRFVGGVDTLVQHVVHPRCFVSVFACCHSATDAVFHFCFFQFECSEASEMFDCTHRACRATCLKLHACCGTQLNTFVFAAASNNGF